MNNQQFAQQSRPSFRVKLLTMALLSTFGGTAMAQDASLESVTVIGTTPLPGLGLTKEQIPANVQSATAEDIRRSGAQDVADFMTRQLGSVHVNDTSGNPLTPDLNYRGFTASPLLGTPQGLSIYVDGVRMNQPFGDVVSWDLIPRAAISNLSLIPGSNPLFGLNTLGGAVAIDTKDGLRNPGTAIQLLLGSHNRRSVELEHGGSNSKGLHWYTTANLHKDDGWRTDSPTRLGQWFGKLGWKDGKGFVNAALSYADNELYGNGLQEQRMLARDYASSYTKPDITNNKSWMLNLTGSREVAPDTLFSGNLYYRRLRTSTLNGDINEGSLDQAVYLKAADRTYLINLPGNPYKLSSSYTENAANTPFPFLRCIAQALQNDEPGEKCTGLLNRSNTTQSNYGASGQFSFLGNLGAHRNQFVLGGAWDRSRTNFRQTTQLGYLNPDRSVTGINAYADGVTGGDVDGEPLDNRVNLDGRTRTYSVFASNTTSFGKAWHMTLAGRYNRTQVDNSDRINPGGGINSLDGHHTFSRFNPAFGLAYAPSSSWGAYMGYNEASRTPTSIELGCANPDNECKLPNAMAGDPPLNQVVTKTIEAGLRGKLSPGVSWNVGVFRAENYDDILFVAGSTPGYGYFKNFGKTRRQGLEMGLNAAATRWSAGVNYTYLDATFQTADSFSANSNSSNSAAVAGAPGLEGSVNVRPGNRLPLTPRHLFKLYADYRVTTAWRVGANVIATSNAIVRGNENSQHQADGKFYLGSGESSGYAIMNLTTNYSATPQLELFGQINNVFDHRYSTGGQLGATGFDANGNFQARPFGGSAAAGFPLQGSTFYAPGAPRSIWVGLRYWLDKPSRP